MPGTSLILTMLNSPETRISAVLGEYAHVMQPFKEYLIEPLRSILGPIEYIDYLSRLLELGPAELEQHLIREIERLRPRLVIWCTYNHEIPETVFVAARRVGAHTVAVTFDDEYRFDVYSRHWAPYMDAFLTNTPDCVERYRALGSEAVFIVPLSGERALDAWSAPAYKYDVSFVGRAKKDRLDFIQILRDAGITVDVFGTAGNKFLSYEQMNETIRASKINLAFSKTIRVGEYGIKGRIFEAPLAGGFLLAEYFPGLDNYYHIGKEIDVFHDAAELTEKVRYYLDNPDVREAVARAGWERACREYTATAFLRQAFAYLLPVLAKREPAVSPEKPGPELCCGFARHNLNINRAFMTTRKRKIVRDTLRLVARYSRKEPEYWLQRSALLLPTACWPALARFLGGTKTWLKKSVPGRFAKRLGLVSWMDDSE